MLIQFCTISLATIDSTVAFAPDVSFPADTGSSSGLQTAYTGTEAVSSRSDETVSNQPKQVNIEVWVFKQCEMARSPTTNIIFWKIIQLFKPKY